MTHEVSYPRSGRTRYDQTLHAILSGKAAVTPEMAARIGKLCGNGPGLWRRMQPAHDLWRVEREMVDELAKIPTLRAA